MNKKPRYGQLLVAAYGGVSIIGAALLMLPISSSQPGTTSLLQAWFTAMSALTVTGLTVVNTGTHWTIFGQAVILLLIQVGGLGLMVFSSVFLLLFGVRMNLGYKVLAAQEQEQSNFTGIATLIRQIVWLVLVIEIIGFVLLYCLFPASPGQSFAHKVFFALFHAVSSFNGAGFDISGASMVPFRHLNLVNTVVIILIFLGSLGYLVLLELIGLFKRRPRLSLHSRLVLIVTVSITLFGAGFYFLTEYTASLAGLSWYQKLVESLFQSITRTCGFVTVPVTSWSEPFQFLSIIMMFIGASPGSVGGGIKTTTFAVIVLAAWSLARGKREVVVMEREIDSASVSKAFTVTVLALVMVCVGTLILMVLENLPFLEVLFEVVSALATVGLTMGITEHLSPLSTFIIGMLMFIGRIGVLSIVVLLGQSEADRIHYMKETIIIG
ncbi:MAG: Trk family potassium uptake protein [Syntrophomonadaceae bacterium]|nr:Trk family potassium uptake protein [Syntrophomonadaceae bacterium]